MPEKPMSPDDAHSSAMSTLQEWSYRAAQMGDGPVDMHTVMAVASGRLGAAVAQLLEEHAPVWMDGRWVCRTCVEITGAVVVQATQPCRVAWIIHSELLDAVAPPVGLQLVVQDGPEPYLSRGATELANMHNLDAEHARRYTATLLSFLGRFGVRR